MACMATAKDTASPPSSLTIVRRVAMSRTTKSRLPLSSHEAYARHNDLPDGGTPQRRLGHAPPEIHQSGPHRGLCLPRLIHGQRGCFATSCTQDGLSMPSFLSVEAAARLSRAAGD